MDSRFLPATLFLGILLVATLHPSTASSFPENATEFELEEEYFFHGKTVEINSTGYTVYGSYDIDNTSYTVVKNQETGEEETYMGARKVRDRETAVKAQGIKSLYLETRLDPLLYTGYSGNLQPEKFEGYAKTLMTGGPHVPTNQAERDLMYEEGVEGKNLMAHRFLGNLTVVRERTESFLENPSYQNSMELVSSYRNAQDGYRDDLGDLVNIYSGLADRRDRDYETWVTQSGKTISYRTILNDLEKINGNAKALEDEIDRREKLLSNPRKPEIRLENPVIPEDEQLSSVYGKDTLEKVYWNRLDRSKKHITAEDIRGPYEVNVACLEENHLVTRLTGMNYPNYMITDGVARRINYTDRKYYSEGFNSVRDLGEGTSFTPEGFPEMEGTLAESDLVFTYCPCPYHEVTGMNWELIDKTKKELNKSRVFHRIDEDRLEEQLTGYKDKKKIMDLVKDGKQAEQMFLDYPSQSRVNTLGDYYHDLYLLGYRASSNGYPVEELNNQSQKAWRLSTLINGKIGAIQRPLKYYESSDFGARGYMYTEATNYDEVNRSNFHHVFDEADVLRHSAFRITFLPDSDTVWRSEEKLDYYSEEEKPPLWTVYRP